MFPEIESADITIETSPEETGPLDRWIKRNGTIMKRLMNSPTGNFLQVTQNAMQETDGQTHVHVSDAGITHRLTGKVFRTVVQLEALLGISVPVQDVSDRLSGENAQ